MGLDGIHPRILKELLMSITKPLSMIFEQYWESREVLAAWKVTNIVRFLRRAKKKDHGNCRPVSLTSVSDKVMEKITLGGTEKHLEEKRRLREVLIGVYNILVRGKRGADTVLSSEVTSDRT